MTKQKKKEIIVATSGYFDPVHIGHIKLFEESKKLGDKLIVIVNSNKQAEMKKGFYFMDEKERVDIIKSIKYVDEVILSIDKDQTQCATLEMLKPDIFTKGGDRTKREIPEADICKRHNIKVIDGVGGRKVQSSSKLIQNANLRKQKARG